MIKNNIKNNLKEISAGAGMFASVVSEFNRNKFIGKIVDAGRIIGLAGIVYAVNSADTIYEGEINNHKVAYQEIPSGNVLTIDNGRKKYILKDLDGMTEINSENLNPGSLEEITIIDENGFITYHVTSERELLLSKEREEYISGNDPIAVQADELYNQTRNEIRKRLE